MARQAAIPRRYPSSSLELQHPDREWRRQYRNALFRAKYERDKPNERERQQIYKHSHPDIAARDGTKRKAIAAAASDGTLTRSAVRSLLRDAFACYYCGDPLGAGSRTVDHVKPLSRGGPHARDNVVVCCKGCSLAKGKKTLPEWLQGNAEAFVERANR